MFFWMFGVVVLLVQGFLNVGLCLFWNIICMIGHLTSQDRCSRTSEIASIVRPASGKFN